MATGSGSAPEAAESRLLYKEDWPECRAWLAAWLEGRLGDHWALGVLAPRQRPLPVAVPPAAPAEARERWLNVEGNLARAGASFARSFYGGIFHPVVTAALGPGSLSAFLGATPHFTDETVWYEPCFRDPADVDVVLSRNNPYWQWTVRALRRCREAAAGKFLVAVPELLDGLDVLAQLFGTERLLTLLVDCPGEIRRLLDRLDEAFFEAYDELRAIAADDAGGNATASYQMWGPGRTLVAQCDFSAMISPAMFAEFVCPHLERQCARVDDCVYHLDGPGAIQHLGALLSVPGLTGIEWTPGAGQPYAADRAWWDRIWRPVYAAGKGAHVWAVPTELIRPFLEEFGQRGTLITTGCDSEAAARRLIDVSASWGR